MSATPFAPILNAPLLEPAFDDVELELDDLPDVDALLADAVVQAIFARPRRTPSAFQNGDDL